MKITEFDAATGITVEREETAQEIADREAAAEAWLEQKRIEEAETAAHAATKAAVLERLGITETEAKALLS